MPNPIDHSTILIEMNGRLGQVVSTTESIARDLVADRQFNRDAHKILGERIEAVSARVSVIEDCHQDQRTTIRTIKFLYAPAAALATLGWPIVWPAIKVALGL